MRKSAIAFQSPLDLRKTAPFFLASLFAMSLPQNFLKMPESQSKSLPLVFALDEGYEQAKIWIDRLHSKIWGFKVGSILFAERGPDIIREIKDQGSKVFLDLKYHDIGRTVQMAVRQSFKNGVDWISIHASGGRAMLELAAQEQTEDQSLVAISVLTSLDQKDLLEIGFQKDLPHQVEDLAQLAFASGVRALVCSIKEVAQLKTKYPDRIFITPGVRLEASQDEQKRTGNLSEAFQQGSSFVVMGRSLYQSKDWKKTWEEIQFTMAEIRSSKL